MIFQLFTASVRSRSLDKPLVPGVLHTENTQIANGVLPSEAEAWVKIGILEAKNLNRMWEVVMLRLTLTFQLCWTWWRRWRFSCDNYAPQAKIHIKTIRYEKM